MLDLRDLPGDQRGFLPRDGVSAQPGAQQSSDVKRGGDPSVCK